MRELVEASGAAYISVYDAVCPRDACAGRGAPLQFDAGHLAADGSLQVARTIAQAEALR